MNISLDADTILNDADGYRARLSRNRIGFSSHAELRGVERNVIQEKCLETIITGVKEPSVNGRWKFTADGITVITDPYECEVVTTWRNPGHGIVLRKIGITTDIAEAHKRSLRRAKQKSTWTSHTVAIVDQSGSMREIDMDKLVMWSDLVWLSLAVDVVAKGLKSGERGVTDMLSVISMRTTSETVIRCQPFDWILYNELVDLLYSSSPICRRLKLLQNCLALAGTRIAPSPF